MWGRCLVLTVKVTVCCNEVDDVLLYCTVADFSIFLVWRPRIPFFLDAPDELHFRELFESIISNFITPSGINCMAITKTSKSFISDFITPTKFQYVAVSEILYAFISDIITTTKVECMAMQPISTSKFSVQDIFHSMYHSKKS